MPNSLGIIMATDEGNFALKGDFDVVMVVIDAFIL